MANATMTTTTAPATPAKVKTPKDVATRASYKDGALHLTIAKTETTLVFRASEIGKGSVEAAVLLGVTRGVQKNFEEIEGGLKRKLTPAERITEATKFLNAVKAGTASFYLSDGTRSNPSAPIYPVDANEAEAVIALARPTAPKGDVAKWVATNWAKATGWTQVGRTVLDQPVYQEALKLIRAQGATKVESDPFA